MSYPSQSPYGNHTSYTPPSGSRPPRRNTALIGGVVIACTAVVLGSILAVTFLVNRGDDSGGDGGDGVEEAADGGETTAPAEGEAEGDPAEVAVAIVEVMYGQSDQSAEELVCADPGALLADPEAVQELAADMLGEDTGLLEFAAGETTETDTGASVEVNMIMGANEYPFATIDLVVEDGSWKACAMTL